MRKKEFSKTLPKIEVIAQTKDWVVINKPALMDSQNSQQGRKSVVDFLQKEFNFSGLVHRLDFGTSGLMVCAKNKDSAKSLTEALQNQKIKKVYRAICFGLLDSPSGEIKFPLDDKDAHTNYKTLEKYNNATLVEVEIITGRKHQIRRHFFKMGHPLLGDHLYFLKGSKLLFTRPALHSAKLYFMDRSFECEDPLDFAEKLKELRKLRL